MTYQVREFDTGWELQDADGNTVMQGDYPLTTPDDIIDAILSDMGIGNPQREALGVVLKRDWTFPDRD